MKNFKIGGLISYKTSYSQLKRYCILQHIEVSEGGTKLWGVWNPDINKALAKESDLGDNRLTYIPDVGENNVKIEKPPRIETWKGLI